MGKNNGCHGLSLPFPHAKLYFWNITWTLTFWNITWNITRLLRGYISELLKCVL